MSNVVANANFVDSINDDVHENKSLVPSIEQYWVKQMQQDDECAFEHLFDAYKSRIFNFINKLINNRGEAEELTQEAFIKIWTNRFNFEEDKPVNAYIFTIARNIVYDYLRKQLSQKKYLEALAKDIGTDDSCLDFLYYSEAEKTIRTLIDQLPPKRRQVFMMNRFEGESYKAIATKLGISENTVDTQIRKALQHLRKHYPEYSKIILVFC